MNIEEAIEAKKHLEDSINELLYQFTSKTGLIVERVYIDYPNIRKMTGEKIIVYQVEIEAKL